MKNVIIECDHSKTAKQSKVHRRVKTLNDITIWKDRNLCCLNCFGRNYLSEVIIQSLVTILVTFPNVKLIP
jgi:hypothetical protein